MSRPNKQGVIGPEKENMNALISRVPESLFSRITKFETDAPEPFFDSSNAKAEDLMAIVKDIRTRLAREDVERLIVLYGSDSMAYLLAALGIGISKKELGEKSVVVTCSMNHLDIENTDAHTNFNRAVLISTLDEIRGKVGLLFDKRFFPPFGIEKRFISNKFAFSSRFHRIAKFNGGVQRWDFDRSKNKLFDEVRGDPNHDLLLVDKIQQYHVGPMTNYSDIGPQIKKNRATILVGLGDGNLRDDKDSIQKLRKSVHKASGPVVVVGSAIYSAEEGIHFPTGNRDEVYVGNSKYIPELISAGPMTATEATVVVSNALAKAEKNKGRRLSKEEGDELIRDTIVTYPFIDLRSSKV